MNHFPGISDRVKYLMRERNLNTSQLNVRLGYVQDNKQAFLKDETLSPSTEFLGRLFKAFPEVDPSWLLFGGKREVSEVEELLKIIVAQQKTIDRLVKKI
ncbi:MAG: hypothetical protein ACOX5K_06095 [Bacteroidales bacterium]|jgi:hypothetical protein|nr:hypothetical protein [Bacteroidota bacterium]